MEHYSFQGPYAYRWLDDVPVERIDHRRYGPPGPVTQRVMAAYGDCMARSVAD